MRLHRIKSILFLLHFILLPVAFTQSPTYYLNPEKKLAQYNTQSWSVENGLPTSSLLGLCQTSDGYLWISSYDGLIRFDGHEFTVFNKNNTDAFESNTIRSLAEDKYGNLWMTTQGNGLVRYSNGEFKRYGRAAGINHLYRAIYIDSLNRIWSASPEEGWFYFQDSIFHFLEHEMSLLNTEVRAIAENSEKGIAFGTFGKGLFIYANNRFTQFTQEEGLLNNWVYSLYFDKNGILWIGTGNGLCYFDGSDFYFQKQVGGVTVNDILEDKFGHLWVATNQGLFRKKKDSNKYEHLSTHNGLPHNFINDFLIDREGNIWMANYKGGLAQLKDGKFTNYTSAGGLHGKVVNAICELDKETYLAAFDNGRMSRIEGEKISNYTLKNNLTGKRIRHILKDSKNNLWISTYSGLLKVTQGGREIWLNERTGFPQTKIRLTYEDSEGNIWVGTRNNGIIKINTDNTYSYFNASKGLSANLIMSIEEDCEGNILVGTSEGESGLSIISKDEIIETFSKKEGFISNVVFNTYCDSEGSIWVAALGGLSLIRDNNVTNFTVKEGLSCDTPYDVIEDKKGYLWLPCSKGIMRIRKSELIDFSDGIRKRINTRLFTQHDGMIESECNATTQSLAASNGNLLFPTINGIAEINPEKILANNFKPPVYVKQLMVDNEPVDLSKKLTFQPAAKRFTFEYTAISLYEPEEIDFKYQLQGFDEGWVEAGNNRSISYTNLPHGNYTFSVIASNNDGIWNTTGAHLSFTVLPRFVNTKGFYVLVISLFVLLSYSIYRIRIQQLKRKHQVLEKTIKDRTKEIREKNEELQKQKAEIKTQADFLEEQKKELNLLNASKDKMFSIIAHDLRSPLGNFRTMVDMILTAPEDFDDDEQKEMLQLLSQNAQSTYELLENLLNWSTSQRGVITYEPQHLMVNPVIMDIVGFMSPVAANKEIELIANAEENLQVYADNNMLRAILRNLIGNAIKFTRRGGKIEIYAERKSNKVEFAVSDNGVGIKPEIKEKLFNQMEHTIRLGTNEEKGSGLGLLLCKDFVEKHKGNIWIESELGQGSTFFFTLPVDKQ
jgi:signal transduction histidine kinase/ligand-binding sensor domain-containing protein